MAAARSKLRIVSAASSWPVLYLLDLEEEKEEGRSKRSSPGGVVASFKTRIRRSSWSTTTAMPLCSVIYVVVDVAIVLRG